ncbi:hypothetical protein [Paramuribaculum intestinale]|uniref:hypothetical protein n=1 Tax=Paramuribaculum intestinale TaxID=2094151 RepID=UPI0025B0F13F|nr:hypothetical protein [Paramuribaculum intestinale]
MQHSDIALFRQRQHLALGGSEYPPRHTPQLLARRLRIDTYPHAMAAQRHHGTPRAMTHRHPAVTIPLNLRSAASRMT